MKQDLLDLTIEETKSFAAALGEKPYRGKQVFQWICRGAAGFEEMTDLPKALRQRLVEKAVIGLPHVLEEQADPGDGTRKFLFGYDDAAVESVFMKYSYGNSLCVSSQVGCKMGCVFCASALGGFVRNLTAGEMMGQVLAAERAAGEAVNHIVIMGMGEPFDNYGNVSRFLRLLHEPGGRNMSWRHLTVSTCGIVPVMQRFAEEFPQVNLAVSLHRIDDEQRSRLMPVNRRYPVAELLEAARAYTEKTGRRITFEYALIRGENDRPRDIEALIRSLRGMLCHVNLIPLNRVEESGLDGTDRERAAQIAQQLTKAGIPATVRRQLGREIDGACGQLRLRRQTGPERGTRPDKKSTP
ncbi:MAG: 23S rRNA (adenine(2503)-C(2))-methyltransferase RlmN [Firmicutes bacterium]|nr:23S rRNA (adenine(2503)-C(2))-methyltransferase RlmN [Bacillota bacterium]